ncbi:hypothetical protein MMC11_008038 [Xylographa trunciseda]|nr:hypothetical protein [Xylographa trunciseda]
MDGISFAIGLVQLVDLCVQYGRGLVDKFQAYKEADTRLNELIVRIKGVWLRTEFQIELLQRIWNGLQASAVHLHRLKSYQEDVLLRLQLKLQAADAEIGALSGATSSTGFRWKKVKYSAFETCLKRVIDELEAWHSRFDPSWFLISLIADTHIDKIIANQNEVSQQDVSAVKSIRAIIHQPSTLKKFEKSIFIDSASLPPIRLAIPGSAVLLLQACGTSDAKLIDTTTYPEGTDLSEVVTDIRDLARLLSISEPSTLGLLKCSGVLKAQTQFSFVFTVPQDLSEPRSLREKLSYEPLALDDRFRIAKSLARAVMAVHLAGIVHKNIRPETIILFKDFKSAAISSFLLGFERFRPQAARSALAGDMVWQRNLYRHPSRQGILPEALYKMQHDIYSLGVCLLEIGLWTSFVKQPQTGGVLDISTQLAMNNKKKAAIEIRATLVAKSKAYLPSRMGITYTDIVVACLTCLDLGDSNIFGRDEELRDIDGILVGVNFIERILVKLEKISI